jgi:hypothetical protein
METASTVLYCMEKALPVLYWVLFKVTSSFGGRKTQKLSLLTRKRDDRRAERTNALGLRRNTERDETPHTNRVISNPLRLHSSIETQKVGKKELASL